MQKKLPAFIYHLADAANWPSIQQHGLLSTSALLDLAAISGRERERIERQHRAQQVILANGVVIRDQNPMPPTALQRCLRGMTPDEWYELLNKKVFFWLDAERLNRMLKANSRRPQVVLTLDTERLLERYAEQAALSPINTGNARRQPALRGRSTFVSYSTWLESRWASEREGLGIQGRSSNQRPVELTVTHAVPDAMRFVVQVSFLESGALFVPSL